jgi:hypothetical protein
MYCYGYIFGENEELGFVIHASSIDDAQERLEKYAECNMYEPLSDLVVFVQSEGRKPSTIGDQQFEDAPFSCVLITRERRRPVMR